MNAEVRKGTTIDEIETQERCYILEVANDSGDELAATAASCSLARSPKTRDWGFQARRT